MTNLPIALAYCIATRSAFGLGVSLGIGHSSLVLPPPVGHASLVIAKTDPLHFAHPGVLWLTALLMALGVLAFFARRRQLKALTQLGSRPALLALATISWKRRALASFCFSMCLSLLLFALAGPRWGFEPQPASANGRDIIVVLDVSRSMLAEDALPNRLERARHALEELANVVQKSGGHRLALVAFAGQAKVVCPLTPDYDHFREALAELDPTDPALVPKATEDTLASGTRIGLGLKQALTLLDPRFHGQQDILLISDGDDPVRDHDWEQGADAARERRVEVHTVGIGNPSDTTIIPDAAGRALTHEEGEVHTRLEERPLEEIARLTGGRYIPARLDVPPLEEWFRAYVRNRPGHGDEENLLPAPIGRAGWFYGAALGFLTLATVIGDRPRRKKEKRAPKKSDKETRRQGDKGTRRRGTLVTASAVVALVVLLGAAPRQSPDELVRAGNAAFHAGQFEAAVEFYSRAEELIDDPGLVAMNKAAALYRLGQFHQAALHYERSLEDAVERRRVDLLYNLGNALLRDALRRNDVRIFDRAIRSYQDCLREPTTPPELQEDAKFNLKLAQTLRQQAKPRDESKDPDKKPEDKPSDDRNPAGQNAGGSETGFNEDPSGAMQRVGKKDLGKDVKQSNRRTPGTGTMQPIPDEDELVPMPPEEAAEHLRRAADNVLKERKQARRTTVANSKRVMNW